MTLAAAAVIAVAAENPNEEGQSVKKSSSGICHCQGGQYYDRTSKFTPFPTIDACLDSGGRHPKRGQGDCTKAGSPVSEDPTAQDLRVLDGDTIDLEGTRIRLQEIDAPEARQSCRNKEGETYPCGKAATSALMLMAASGDVRCDLEPEKDRYGRALGICYAADDTDINGWLVRQGYALAYREYSERYAAQEDQARAEGKGLHSGAHVAPWDWRKGKRLKK